MKGKMLLSVIALLFVAVIGFGAIAVNATYRDEAVPAATLRQGSTGSEVRTMQRKLKNWGYYTGAVDGIFGAQTKKAVKYFQSKNGLTADGIVGPKTLAALGMGGSVSAGTNGYSNSDVYLRA